jgi:3'(2'), 5'-bisphosphate nucleotidase
VLVNGIKLIDIINIVKEASKEVLSVYNSKDYGILTKEDKTPLTIADRKSHNIIFNHLRRMVSHIPVLSEEGKNIPYEKRVNWHLFWLIDPLDGTKEFIRKNGEFTINVALIEKNSPLLGVVAVPVRDEIYFGIAGNGAYKVKDVSKININHEEVLYKVAKRLPQSCFREKIIVVGSRSHSDEKTEGYIQKLKSLSEIEVIPVGSSYKLCYLAEGLADVYPRFGTTMEWDIAAGHIILKEAGGRIYNAITLSELVYNKPCLENPPFIAESHYFREKYGNEAKS